MAAAIPSSSTDPHVLIVSYVPPAESVSDAAPAKVLAVTGQYMRTKDACFRKEGGETISFVEGYWNFLDRQGEQTAWAEKLQGELGRPTVPPKTGWQTKGEGFFGSWEDLPITVECRQLPPAQAAGLEYLQAQSEVCCSTAMYQKAKEQLPERHRDTLTDLEEKALERKDSFKALVNENTAGVQDLHAQHWPVVKEKALLAHTTAKDTFNEYHPVVKQKSQEAYNKVYDFATHPDTVDTVKKTGNTCLDGVKFCAAGCVTLVANLLESAFGKNEPQARSGLPASSSDQSMEDSYVKLDSTTPVLVEPTFPPVPLPPGHASLANPAVEPKTQSPNRTLFLGDPDDDIVTAETDVTG